jgi:hypothetical protein
MGRREQYHSSTVLLLLVGTTVGKTQRHASYGDHAEFVHSSRSGVGSQPRKSTWMGSASQKRRCIMMSLTDVRLVAYGAHRYGLTRGSSLWRKRMDWS